MKTLLVAAATLLSVNSFASIESVNCQYTEPNINTAVDIETMTILIDEAGSNGLKTEKIRSIDIVNGVITYQTKNTTLKVDLTKQGNNGMSDDMMDFDSHITTKTYAVYGGCNRVSK